MLAASTENQLIRQVEYLKAENQMLRKRVGKRVNLAADEKALLLKLGQAVGAGLRQLISIVCYETFRAWVKKGEGSAPEKPKGAGRPKTEGTIREMIIRIAQETGWGYTRIMGELKKLGISPPSRTTVKNILKAEGLEPGPKRGAGTWDEFLAMHAHTLWQCDFFSKKIWTLTGLRQCFVLAFVHVGSRKVFVTEATFKPDTVWMQAAAESFIEHTQQTETGATLLMRDRDSIYIPDFDGALSAAGIEVKKVGFRSPNMNAFAERWIQSIQQECLDNFIVFGEEHFNHLVSEYLVHYHTERPHQSMGNRLLSGEEPEVSVAGEITCQQRLGGLLKSYQRKAG
jgi:putative transposase